VGTGNVQKVCGIKGPSGDASYVYVLHDS